MSRCARLMRHCSSVILTSVLLFFCASAAHPVAAQTLLSPLEIDQISWDMSASIGEQWVQPDSEYAHLRFDFQPDPTQFSFLNVTARIGSTGSGSWLVQNMPIMPQSQLMSTTSESSTVLDLTPLGLTRNSPIGGPFEYEFSFSSTPQPNGPFMDPFAPAGNQVLAGGRAYSHGGDIVPGETFPTPSGFLPPPVPNNKVPWNGDTSLKAAWRPGMPNGEQGTNQCGPAAIANSMHWLQSQYPNQVNLNGQSWNQTLEKLKADTNWTPLGIGQRDAIEGKLRFAQREDKTFPPGYIVKYQADAGLTDLGGQVTVDNATAQRNGNGGAPQFDWLLSELQGGEDVEVSIDWLNAAGEKDGGHVASVTGAAMYGNKLFVWTNDDGNQGDKIENPNYDPLDPGSDPFLIPPLNGGLRTNLAHQVTIENGGYMRFNGFGVNNRIKAIYSESIPEPASLVLMLAGLVALARFRR